MTQIVSKQSLNVLASLAFQTLMTDPTTPSRPECNLDGGAAFRFSDLLSRLYDVENEYADPDHRHFFYGYAEGVELGLSIAAVIISNGLNADATCNAVKSEIDDASGFWPEKSKSKEAA